MTTVKKYRTEVLQQLEEISDSLEKDLAADTQRVRNVLNSMLQLQNRACQALTSARDTDVLEMEKEMTEGEGSPQRLRNLEDGLPDTSYRLGLHSDFTNDIEGYIKRFMGSPVKLYFPSEEKVDMVNLGRCGDGERCDIHSLRQKEDRRIQVFYGEAGDGFSKEKESVFLFTGSKRIEQEYGFRISCVTRKDYIMQWNRQSRRIFGSKNESLFYILQDCATKFCKICSVDLRQTEYENSISGTALLHPKVHKVHNFDSYKQGQLFAVVDENDNSKKRNEEKEDKMASRVVRLYSRESNDPVTTYTPPNQPFFPTDICFFGDGFLLIADWLNDCVHVTRVTDYGLKFIQYLAGSGDIVRPTALNFDLNGQLLIGCGDGWVLKYPFDIADMNKTLSRKRKFQGVCITPNPKNKK